LVAAQNRRSSFTALYRAATKGSGRDLSSRKSTLRKELLSGLRRS
jgi:hypothetical protein